MEQALPGMRGVEVVFKDQVEFLEAQPSGRPIFPLRLVIGGQVIFGAIGLGGSETLECQRPVALVIHSEPTPDLRVLIVGDQVVPNIVIMVPNPLLGTARFASDPRRRATLLSKLKSLLVAHHQIPLDDAVWRRR